MQDLFKKNTISIIIVENWVKTHFFSGEENQVIIAR